jgi:hypothetical protein
MDSPSYTSITNSSKHKPKTMPTNALIHGKCHVVIDLLIQALQCIFAQLGLLNHTRYKHWGPAVPRNCEIKVGVLIWVLTYYEHFKLRI